MAETRGVFFNAHDIDRIRGFLELATSSASDRYVHLRGLKERLAQAEVVPPGEMPPHTVTMNTRVKVQDVDSKEHMEFILVFPQDADYEQKKVSLLAPLGAALLGSQIGQTVRYQAPGGTSTILVEEILYQPEASGDYDL